MDFTAEKPWERILGDDTIKRVEFTAQSATEYRRNAHLPAVDSEIQALHNQYIHELGADFLRAKLAYNKEKELEKEKLIRKQAKVGKVLRRKIKVSDLEDGGVAITIDQEWDTSTWSKEQIEAGCEALVMVFYEDEKKTSLERKERAVQMLQKLLSRHTVAITYLRQSIEMIIGKSVSKLIIQGQTCAILNLLFILHSSKDIYQEELSQYTFCVRAIEMLLQEARLAAILIQHTFRAYSNRMRKVDYSSQNTGFGTEMEIKMSKILLVNARSAALRSRWRSMHNRYPAAERAIVGGIRGPIYIKSMFIIKAIEIVLYLVAPAMGKRAPGNREDVVRANGCILLSYFIGCPTSPYSYMSTELLAYITKVPESFYRAMHSGCIHSCLRLLKYLRMIGVGSFNLKEKKNDIYTPTRTYLHCVDTIINSAVHAAGIYRGLKGYRFVKQAEAEVERVDYCAEYRHIYKNEDAFHRDVRQLLVFPNLLKEVAHVIISTQNFTILKKLLQCVFAVSCTSGHSAVHSEVIAWAGTLMVKLIDLLHNDSDDIGTLALSIFLQQCVDSVCRQSLIHMNIAFNLSPLNKIYVQEYGNLKHQRSLLAGIALCRQCNWRYYDPQELPKVLAADGSLRKSIFLDLLKTMKNPDDAIVEELSIADLVVLPNDTKTTLELSKVVKSFNAKEITNFLSHPDDPWYYESLPIEEACAVCTIIEGLSADKETARIIYSPGVVNYLGKFLFLAKYLFMGKPMLDSVIVLLLSGVKSITAALGQLAIACRSSHSMAVEYIDVVHNCDLISSGLFFLETLTVAHEKVDASTKELQKLVGLACLDYFSGYASMIIDTLGPQAREAEDLHTMGKAVINLFPFLKTVHGKSKSVIKIFSNCCNFLCCATSPKSGAYIAIHEWNILNAICIYLPTPLSGLIIDNSNSSINSSGSNEEYKMSLEDLPASFFELCANLCQIEEGKAHCFADGYLRRALDKLSIIHVHFMDWWRKVSVVRKLSSINIKAINRQLNSTPTPVFSDDIRAKVLACLHLIAKVSGYNDPRKGSANDVILNSFYSIVEVCRDLIDCQLIERNNPLIEAAFDVVAQLAVDTYRISVMMEKTNFFATIREQLQDCELLTSRSAELALSILRDSTLHLTSDYIFRMVPSIRMPVSKVMRVYPNLSDVVRDASWTLTKSVVIYRANVPEDSDIFHDPEAVAFDEFVRTGVPVLSPKGKAAKDFRNKISNKSIFEMNNSLLQKLVMEDHPINAVDAKNYSLGKNNVDGNLVSNLNNQESKLNEQSVPSSEYSDGNFEIYSEHYSEDFLSLENSAISENIVKEQFNIDGNKVADGFTIKKAKEAAGRRRSFVFVNSDGSIDKQSKPSSSSQGNLHASDGELCKNSIGSSNPNHENYLNESRNDFVQKNGMQSVGLMSILNSKSIPAIDRPSLLPQLDNRYLANADEYGNADKHVVPTKMGGGSTKPGTYTRCGVSSCGGLRTNVISAGHEEYYTKTKDEAEKELLQTNILHKGIDVLPVSQLSARDPALKELVHYRKGRMGFAELDKYDPNSSPSKTATAKKTKSKKMLNGSTSALQNSPLRKQKKEDFSNFWNADNRSEAGKVQASDVKIPTISIEELPELLITRPRK